MRSGVLLFGLKTQSMIPKSGIRFSEKIMLKQKQDLDPARRCEAYSTFSPG
jgi:hypothetical protein